MARIPRFDGGETAGHTEEDPEARPPADAADVDSAIAELGRAASDAIVRVYKWTRDAASQESTWARCLKIPAAEFDADQVGAQYGPGRYRFEIVQRGKILRHARLTFAALAAPAAAAPAAHAGALSAESLLTTFITMQQQLTLALIQNLRGGQPSTTPAEMIGLFTAGLNAGKKDTPADSLLEAVKMGTDLGRAAAGLAPSDEGEGMGLLERLAPKALEIVSNLTARQPAGVPIPTQRGARPPAAALTAATRVNQQASPPAANPPEAAEPSGLPELPAALRMLARQYAPKILEEAAAGRDAARWGDFIAERVPEVWIPVLVEFCKADPVERMGLLKQFEPGLSNHAAWIDEAAAAILDCLEGEDGDEGDEAPEDAGDERSAPPGANSAG
jgi:hypothetical protein